MRAGARRGAWLGLALSLWACRGGDLEAERAAVQAASAAVSAASAAVSAAAAAASAAPASAPARPPSAAPAAPAHPPAAPPAAGGDAFRPGLEGPLPPSDRVFAVSLDGGPQQALLGADGDALWAVSPTAVGQGRALWRVTGPGVVQRVVAGDLGRGWRIYVARGLGRGHLAAPLVLQALDPATGAAEELWRFQGARTECAHLSITALAAEGGGPAQPALAFAYYSSKYHVRTRHLLADGRIREGDAVRMASSRAFGDLDGDGRPDEVVGRLYGDAKGEPGDLRVDLGRGPVSVPTENGVRAVHIARLPGDDRPTLYFADGWLADYGKQAKAQLKRARYDGAGFQVETLARSEGEFTFFQLEAADLDGQGPALVAQGNLQVSAVVPGPKAPWALKPLARIDPVLNTALGRTAAGAVVFVPARPQTRAVPVP